MLSGGPDAHWRTCWIPSTTPSTSSPDCDATGTTINVTVPAATSRNSTVTTDAATAPDHPRDRRNRTTGQVNVVINNAITTGQITDHIHPNSHNTAAANPNTNNPSSPTRAADRNAPRARPESTVSPTDPPKHPNRTNPVNPTAAIPLTVGERTTDGARCPRGGGLATGVGWLRARVVRCPLEVLGVVHMGPGCPQGRTSASPALRSPG
ncbi:hypothetical protein Aglo03_41370 [Actinokineospora globicatena]|uniref:Uncharacterized protein n=1 Tax=Actinokineospora globicatena TaxID=103729 RepID=A0A9W6VBM9_9PSEU|nr:hypothetical protein Aglo03_41370 [Actinokineospora globicatena]